MNETNISRYPLSAVPLAIGVWLLVAPFVLGYENAPDAAVVNDIVVGALVVLASVITLFSPLRWAAFALPVLGIWLIVAPIVLDYGAQTDARANDVVFGILLLIFGIVEVMTSRADPEVAREGTPAGPGEAG